MRPGPHPFARAPAAVRRVRNDRNRPAAAEMATVAPVMARVFRLPCRLSCPVSRHAATSPRGGP